MAEDLEIKEISKADIRKARARDIRNGSKELPPTWFSKKYKPLDTFVKGQLFESLVGVVIALNCGTMGIEINGLVVDQSAALTAVAEVSENLFTVFFVGEFFLRFFFMGWRVYVPTKSPLGVVDALSNDMDACLVWITGVGTVWLLPLLGIDASNLRLFQVLRAFRLLRLVRIIRTNPAFAEVYMLVRGLIDSTRTLCWTVAIITFITYIFAIFGVVTVSVDVKDAYDMAALPGSGADEVEIGTLTMLRNFTDGVIAWMYTFIQILTLDSWNAFGRPLKDYSHWSWVLIYAYICVAVLVFMNLVTAVIVENALAHSKEDEVKLLALKEAETAKHWKLFQLIFLMMDTDQSGTLTIDEFHHAFQMEEVATKLKLLSFKEEDCKVLFDLLDSGDGSLSLEEFFGGCQSMKGSAQAKEVFVSRKKIERIWHLLSHFGQEVDENNAAIFKGLNKASFRKKRPGTLAHRAKTLEEKSIKKMTSPTSELKSPTSPQTPANAFENSQVDLVSSLQDLRTRIDSLGADAQNKMKAIHERLNKVEERNMATARAVQQFSASRGISPAMPAAPVSAFAAAPAAPASVQAAPGTQGQDSAPMYSYM
mmetsp:Transcript_89818/g.159757  ORF Transcript_89818/g.159757 Transcript_89818/m.159757 type:complete len:595 (+) Transcript_89818:69-1853(+)